MLGHCALAATHRSEQRRAEECNPGHLWRTAWRWTGRWAAWNMAPTLRVSLRSIMAERIKQGAYWSKVRGSFQEVTSEAQSDSTVWFWTGFTSERQLRQVGVADRWSCLLGLTLANRTAQRLCCSYILSIFIFNGPLHNGLKYTFSVCVCVWGFQWEVKIQMVFIPDSKLWCTNKMQKRGSDDQLNNENRSRRVPVKNRIISNITSAFLCICAKVKSALKSISSFTVNNQCVINSRQVISNLYRGAFTLLYSSLFSCECFDILSVPLPVCLCESGHWPGQLEVTEVTGTERMTHLHIFIGLSITQQAFNLLFISICYVLQNTQEQTEH